MLSLEDVEFSHGRHRVFTGLDVSFDVRPTVLLGPNGAGKSTLMALAAGVLRARRGSVALDGVPIGRDARNSARRIGWMPQQIAAVPRLTCVEQVVYAGWLKGLSAADARSRAAGALEQVDLAARSGDRASSLSGGQLRRLGLAAALVAEPSYLLLDEPTAGLDPSQRRRFGAVLTSIVAAGGVSVVVSTHQTEDLDALYERVVVLDAGQLRFDGTTDEFLGGESDVVGPRDAELAYARYVEPEV